MPSGYSSVSLVCTSDRDTARLSEKPFGNILPTALQCPLQPTLALHPPEWKFSIHQCCVSIKVSMVICTLGDTRWRFGSAPSDGGGWIPIRGLTFHGHSSNGVVSWGQKLCIPGLFPQGWEENYEQKVKARERLMWRSVTLFIWVWSLCRQICFSSFVFLSCLLVSWDDLIWPFHL